MSLTENLLRALSEDPEHRTPEQLALKLGEEAGEVSREIKLSRKENMVRRGELKEELGDVLSATLKLAWHYGILPSELVVGAASKRGLR